MKKILLFVWKIIISSAFFRVYFVWFVVGFYDWLSSYGKRIEVDL